MQITVSDLGPNNMYVELLQEDSADGGSDWVRIKIGYKGKAASLNTGVNLNEALAISRAFKGIAGR